MDDLAAASEFCLEHWDPAATQAPRSDSGEPLELLNVGIGSDSSFPSLQPWWPAPQALPARSAGMPVSPMAPPENCSM